MMSPTAPAPAAAAAPVVIALPPGSNNQAAPQLKKKGMPKGAFTRWCFTLFDHVPEIDTSKMCSGEDKKKEALVRYFLFQEESCPGTLRRHRQGYLELNERHRGTTVKALFLGEHGKTVHLEVAFATQQQNIDYCSKVEGDGHPLWLVPQAQGGWMGKGGRVPGTHVTRWGTPAASNDFNEHSRSAKRARSQKGVEDLLEIIHGQEMMPTLEDLEELFPAVVFHHRSKVEDALLARAIKSIPAYRKVKPEIYHGDTGTGKSFGVYAKYGQRNIAKLQDPTGKWFPKEVAWKPVLLIEEFSGRIPVDDMKQILDVYPIQKEKKGGFVPAAWTRVIICSNIDPADWWKDKDGKSLITTEDRNAFMNRFSKTDIHHMTGVSKRVERMDDEDDQDNSNSSSLLRPVGVTVDEAMRAAEFPAFMGLPDGERVLAAFAEHVYDRRLFAEMVAADADGEKNNACMDELEDGEPEWEVGGDAGGADGGGLSSGSAASSGREHTANPFVVMLERSMADESYSFASRFGLACGIPSDE